MNKKKVIFVITIILLVIFLTLGIILVVNNEKQKEKQNLEDINLINTNYESLKSYVDVFNENRVSIYNNILNNFYYEEVENNYDSWINLFKDYEKSVISMKNIIDTLDVKCKLKYDDNNIKQKCINYKKTYESVVNTLVKDVEVFNNQLNNYNQWIEKENGYPKKGNYTSNFNDYIDYDNDKAFSGK